MSTGKWNWAIGLFDCLYWIGVAMSVATFGLILAGNTELISRVEHSGFPLSWACAGAAVLAFLAAELSDFAFSVPSEAKETSPQLSPEWESVEP